MWFCFFFKQKTAFEIPMSEWSSDVCSSDLRRQRPALRQPLSVRGGGDGEPQLRQRAGGQRLLGRQPYARLRPAGGPGRGAAVLVRPAARPDPRDGRRDRKSVV